MTDAEQIAAFVAERGVTRCPVAYLWTTQAAADRRGTIGETDERAGKRWGQSGSGHRTMAKMRRKAADIAAHEEVLR